MDSLPGGKLPTLERHEIRGLRREGCEGFEPTVSRLPGSIARKTAVGSLLRVSVANERRYLTLEAPMSRSYPIGLERLFGEQVRGVKLGIDKPLVVRELDHRLERVTVRLEAVRPEVFTHKIPCVVEFVV